MNFFSINKVIYIDTADSSGWIQSKLLPIVDFPQAIYPIKNIGIIQKGEFRSLERFLNTRRSTIFGKNLFKKGCCSAPLMYTN